MATAAALMDESPFDMSIDLTAALSDEHLNDPVSASAKAKRWRASSQARASVRSSRRLATAGAGGGKASVRNPGRSSRLQSIGENFRHLGLGAGDDSSVNSAHSGGFSVSSGGSAPRSARMATSRRKMLQRQPSIVHRSSVARLVTSAASQLRELENFLRREDSQAGIVFGCEDDSVDDESVTSMQEELRHLTDFEEEMRKELEELWSSGAVGGWQDTVEDENKEEKGRNEKSIKDENEEEKGKGKICGDDTESAATQRVAAAVVVDEADSAAGTRRGAPSAPAPASSAAALAGGLSLASRRSSAALDLAGLEDFAAKLERQWEEAVMLEESIFGDDNDDEGSDDDGDDGGQDSGDEEGQKKREDGCGDTKLEALRRRKRDGEAAFFRSRSMSNDEAQDVGGRKPRTLVDLGTDGGVDIRDNEDGGYGEYEELDDAPARAPGRMQALRRTWMNLSTIQSGHNGIGDSARSIDVSASSRGGIGDSTTSPTDDTEAVSVKEKKAEDAVGATKSLKDLPKPPPAPPPSAVRKAGLSDLALPSLDETVRSRSRPRPQAESELPVLRSLPVAKRERSKAPPPRPSTRGSSLLRLLDKADVLAEILYGRTELGHFGLFGGGASAAPTEGKGAYEDAAPPPRSMPPPSAPAKTRQGAAILHLLLTALLVRVLRGEAAPLLHPTPKEVLWPCAALVPFVMTAAVEWSLPKGAEDVRAGAGLAVLAWAAEHLSLLENLGLGS